MDIDDVLLLYAADILDEEDVAACMLPNYESRLLPRQSLHLDSMTDLQCQKNFRFKREDLSRLANALLFPEVVVLDNRCRSTGLEILCVVLRRLCYPNRLHDLEELFGKTGDVISRIFNFGLEHIHGRFGHLLDTLGHSWLTREELQTMAAAAVLKGSPYDGVILLTDGTVSGICRPNLYQNIVYNGYKRKHALKYQSSTSVHGLVLHLVGPIIGSRHDNRIWKESNLSTEIQKINKRYQTQYYAYGDQGYQSTPQIMTPFRANRSPEETACNRAMIPVRLPVEWAFGKITAEFAFLDFPKNLKIHLQPVGLYYRVAVLLTNALTCLYGSKTGSYFGVEPPSLEMYFLG